MSWGHDNAWANGAGHTSIAQFINFSTFLSIMYPNLAKFSFGWLLNHLPHNFQGEIQWSDDPVCSQNNPLYGSQWSLGPTLCKFKKISTLQRIIKVSLFAYKQTKHQKPKMKKKERKGNKKANKQHPKKKEKWFCLLSSLSCRQIWLSPLLDDGQPTHLTILLIRKQWSGAAVCSQKSFV
jgi:hypothetical protein